MSSFNDQTPLDYKDYFHNKFVNLFKELVVKIINFLPDGSEEKTDMMKIFDLSEKLNYDKIIKKISENTQLIEVLLFMSKNDFSDEMCEKYLKSNQKFWTIMPSFNINKIMMKISKEDKYAVKQLINNLHICGVTYGKVIEQMSSCQEGESFNPFDSVGKVAENMDISTLYEGVEVKNISAYEMLMESIINQQMDNKMSDYMSNIKEDDVNEAASKLNDVLNSDKFGSNKQTTKILSDMLSNIKSEVIGLKSESDKLKGKQGVEQLLGIAQKVAGNMMGTIKDSNVSVLEIWDATSTLAKNTVQSDALNIVDNLIRSNIEANLKNAQARGQHPNQTQSSDSQNLNQSTGQSENTENTENIESLTGIDLEKESRKKRREKRKEKK